MVATAKDARRRILVVDDDQAFCHAIGSYLQRAGYDVETALGGSDALASLDEGAFDLLLLDLGLSDISGFDVVPKALADHPDLGILILSGQGDAASAARCMQLGALDYLTKPLDPPDLERAVLQGLRRRDALADNRRLSGQLRARSARSKQDAEDARLRLESVILAAFDVLVNTLEARLPSLAGHSHRIAALAATIADKLGLVDDEVEQVRLAGRVHDIGKLGIREEVLTKDDSLTPTERDHVRQHVTIGARILAPLAHFGSIVEYVRTHHERWDGKGYPDGLSGEAIPLGGRILCAAEVFDALTTDRPGQPGLTPREAVARMADLAETVLDPRVLRALHAAVASRRTLTFIDDEQAVNATDIGMLQ